MSTIKVNNIVTPNNGESVSITTGGAQRVIVDSSGRVGLGTTTPSDANSNADDLVIQATGSGAGITIFSDTDNYGNIFFGDSSSAAHRGRLRYDHANDALTLSTSATERLRIDSSGRLLVGTSSSTTVWGYGQGSLQLMGDYQGASASFINNEANTNSHAITLAKTRNGSILQNGDTFGAIVFSGDDSNGYYAAARIIANVDGTPSDNVMPGRLSFQTGGTGGGTPTERLRIDSSGNVGIGTSSPGRALEIGTSSPAIKFNNGTNAWSIGTGAFIDGSDSFVFFEEGIGERMRIDSSGRVGIGVSPSTFNGNGDNLVISSGGDTGITIDATSGTNSSIHFADGPNGSEAYRGYIVYRHNGDSMAFGTSADERMRIDSSGNVGIGTSSPSDKLTVAGHINLPNVNSYIKGGGHNVLQVDATRTYFYGGTNGVQLRKADNSGEIVTVDNNGSVTFATGGSFGGEVTINGTTATTQRYFNLKDAGSSTYRAALRRDAWYLGTGVSNIGDVTPGNANIVLKMNGDAIFSGSVTASNVSDVRFKENITDANPQLADAVALGSQLKNFDWNDDAPLNEELRAKRFLGLIAQEAEKVCPGLTYTVPRTKQGKELTPAVLDEEGNETKPATYEELDDSYKAINHDILVMKLLGAVAELSAKVSALEAG